MRREWKRSGRNRQGSMRGKGTESFLNWGKQREKNRKGEKKEKPGVRCAKMV